MSEDRDATRLVVTGVETSGSVAEKAGVDASVIRRALRSGRLPGNKVGGLWLIPAEAADHWIKTRKKGRPPKRPSQLEFARLVDEDNSD